MYKITKLMIALFVMVIFFLISGIIFMNSYDNSIFGILITGDSANKVFSALFSWQYTNNYIIIGDASANSKGKANNFMFYLRPIDDSLNNEYIIIGFLDDLNFYKDDIKIHNETIKDSYVKTTISSPSKNYIIKIIYPNSAFNIRKVSKGEELEIFGLEPFAIKDFSLCSNKLKIIEGELDSIGFCVMPNNGFIKNHKIVIQMTKKVYGALIFLTNDKGQRIFIIHYMEKITDSKSYKPYLDNFLKLLCDIELKPIIQMKKVE